MSRKTPSIEELETASKVLGWLFEKYCRKIDTRASSLEIHTLSDKITRLSLVNDTILNERFIMERDRKKEVKNES